MTDDASWSRSQDAERRAEAMCELYETMYMRGADVWKQSTGNILTESAFNAMFVMDGLVGVQEMLQELITNMQANTALLMGLSPDSRWEKQ